MKSLKLALQQLGISFLLIGFAAGQEAAKKDPHPVKLFFDGEYEKCIGLVVPLLPKLDKPSEEHEEHLLTLGGSYHYLGMFHEAQPHLDEYHSLYGVKAFDVGRLIAASYFQAANYSRLQQWTKSSTLLDTFLKKYPDPEKNIYLPYALFDRANCHYAGSEYDEGLKKITEVEKKFPDITILEQVLTLKGNILESVRKKDEAKRYYLKALDIAETKNNELVAAECLFYLTALLGRESNPRIAEALPYYDRFWKKYGATSPFSAKVAAAGTPAMRKAGKIDEAMKRLQSAISEIASIPDSPGLEEAIGSYSEEFLKQGSIRELQKHFSGIHGSMAQKALYQIAIIDAYEKELASHILRRDKESIAETEIIFGTLFLELQRDFKLNDLSNFILVRIGDHNLTETKNDQTARIYYQEVLNRRNDTSHLFDALLGLAEVNAKGTNDQKKEALPLLNRVVDDSDNISDRDRAFYLMASIYADLGDHEKAISFSNAYLSQKEFRRYKPDCRMILGGSHQAKGNLDDALIAYQEVWTGSMGRLGISNPALKNWMTVLWKRNEKKGPKSDRQAAYEAGYKFIKMTSRAVKKATLEEQAQWKEIAEIVRTYEASPDTRKIVK